MTPSIHGQWLVQTTKLGKDEYAYDAMGRLVEVHETPLHEDCTTAVYGYDDSSNRTSETTRSSTEAKCAMSGGTSTNHAYDSAERLADPGTQYEALGEDATLPATDTGGSALETSYYADGSVYSASQKGTINKYLLDPAGRKLETSTSSLESSGSTILHYSSGGSTPSWTESSTGAISRNIDGVNGALAAVQTGATAVTIEIANLHGDIVGAAADSNEVKEPTLAKEPSAFGVPPAGGGGTPFQWLGASGIQTEFESGVADSGKGLYVPQVGIHLLANASPSALQDPVNEYLNNTREATPIGETNATSPGAVEPVFVPESALHEFWEHPPWDVEPQGNTSVGLETEGEGASIGKVHESGPHQVGPCKVHSRGDPAALDDATFWSFSSWADCLTAVYEVNTWDVVGGLVSTIEHFDYIPANQKASWHGSLETLPDVNSGEFCFFGHYNSKGHDTIFGRCLPMLPTI